MNYYGEAGNADKYVDKGFQLQNEKKMPKKVLLLGLN